MRKIQLAVAISLNGNIMDGFSYNFGDVQDAEDFNTVINRLTFHLSALLEAMLTASASDIHVGHLKVVSSCGVFHKKVLDISGIMPVNSSEISEMLLENNVSEKIRNLMLNYILSTKV